MLENIKNSIIAIFDKHLGDKYLLFIFGSTAKDKNDRSSDIDLAVYTKDPISSSSIMELKEELENKVYTLRDIDLVNLTDPTINNQLLFNILREGIIWKEPKNSKELLKSLKRRLKNLKK